MVTFDVADFPRIARQWAEAGRVHAGCAILVRIDHGEFGGIPRALDEILERYPNDTDWNGLTRFISRV